MTGQLFVLRGQLPQAADIFGLEHLLGHGRVDEVAQRGGVRLLQREVEVLPEAKLLLQQRSRGCMQQRADRYLQQMWIRMQILAWRWDLTRKRWIPSYQSPKCVSLWRNAQEQLQEISSII